MPPSTPDCEFEGLVVAAHGRRGRLETPDGRILPYLVKGRRLKVVCGDEVCWQAGSDGTATVISIQERRNALKRWQAHGHSEILAANLSCVGVVVAPVPAPDWFVVDRFLCAAAVMPASSIVIANKTDLGDKLEPVLDEYRRIGYTLVQVSAATGAGMDALQAVFQDQTGILVGQSGVGKSSLINRLIPDAGIDTGELTRKRAEGTHTTTASVMHQIPGSGRLIDSPGVRDFLPAIAAGASIQSGFPEIEAASAGCRFSNCRHLREPGCAVKAAVAQGEISARRYESYKRLLRTVAEHWSD